MSIGTNCDLCSSKNNLSAYTVLPKVEILNNLITVCETCKSQINNPSTVDANHWRALHESIWSEVPAVQVVVWRQLNQLSSEGWAQDLLDQLYLSDDILEWAKAMLKKAESNDNLKPTKDSNGIILFEGDSVTLIKDLDVKGANFTAKRGTLVRNITLTNNPEHIEGKVNGTHIVLVSAYLKKV